MPCAEAAAAHQAEEAVRYIHHSPARDNATALTMSLDREPHWGFKVDDGRRLRAEGTEPTL